MNSPANSPNLDRRAFLRGAGIAAIAGVGGAVTPRSARAAALGDIGVFFFGISVVEFMLLCVWNVFLRGDCVGVCLEKTPGVFGCLRNE